MLKLTAGKYCKSKGITIKRLCELTGKTAPTFDNWFKKDRAFLDIVIDGCLAKGINRC